MSIRAFYIIAVAGLAIATAVQAQTTRDSYRKEPVPPSIATIRRTLQDARTPRAAKEQSLLALPRHGAASVPTLLEFSQSVRSERGWDKTVAQAMAKVLDRRLLPSLSTLATSSADPEAQAQAIKALGAFASQSLILVVTKNSEGGFSFTSLGGSFQSTDDIVAKGTALTVEDRERVRAVVERIKARKNLPDVVRRAVDDVSDRLDRLAAEEEKKLSALHR